MITQGETSSQEAPKGHRGAISLSKEGAQMLLQITFLGPLELCTSVIDCAKVRNKRSFFAYVCPSSPIACDRWKA